MESDRDSTDSECRYTGSFSDSGIGLGCLLYCYVCGAPAVSDIWDDVRVNLTTQKLRGWDGLNEKNFVWISRGRVLNPDFEGGISEAVQYHPLHAGEVHTKELGGISIFSGDDEDDPDWELSVGVLLHEICFVMLRSYIPSTVLSPLSLHAFFINMPNENGLPKLHYGILRKLWPPLAIPHWPINDYEAYFLSEPILNYCPASLRNSNPKPTKAEEEAETEKGNLANRLSLVSKFADAERGVDAKKKKKKNKKKKNKGKKLAIQICSPPLLRKVRSDQFEFLKEEDLLSSMEKIRVSVGPLFSRLPREIVVCILDKLDATSLSRLQAVSWGWRRVVRRQSYWKKRYADLVASLPLASPYVHKISASQDPNWTSAQVQEFNRIYRDVPPVEHEDFYAAYWELRSSRLRNTVRIHSLLEQIAHFQRHGVLPKGKEGVALGELRHLPRTTTRSGPDWRGRHSHNNDYPSDYSEDDDDDAEEEEEEDEEADDGYLAPRKKTPQYQHAQKSNTVIPPPAFTFKGSEAKPAAPASALSSTNSSSTAPFVFGGASSTLLLSPSKPPASPSATTFPFPSPKPSPTPSPVVTAPSPTSSKPPAPAPSPSSFAFSPAAFGTSSSSVSQPAPFVFGAFTPGASTTSPTKLTEDDSSSSSKPNRPHRAPFKHN